MCKRCLEERINSLSEKQAKFALINLSKSYHDAVSIIVNGAEKDDKDGIDQLDRIYVTNRRRLFS